MATGKLRGFAQPYTPDYPGFLSNLRREGTPDRVWFVELFLDPEVQDEIDRRFGVTAHLDPGDPDYAVRRLIALQQFLGYDYVRVKLEGHELARALHTVQDTASAARAGGREWIEEGFGPIRSWDDFERYPWPQPADARTEMLEAALRHLPEGMCLAGSGLAHFFEELVELFGYEGLCFALYDNRDLVRAAFERLLALNEARARIFLQCDRVELLWHSDDMGHKTGPLISPADLREFVLPGHRRLAHLAHEAGRLTVLHSCGNRRLFLDDLLEDVRVDALHSWEDTIERITDAKSEYGDRVALLGGIDVDFLCRAPEQAVRARVRETLDVCQPGGGYALGTGNSVANYVPVDQYLAMLDEGRLYGR